MMMLAILSTALREDGNEDMKPKMSSRETIQMFYPYVESQAFENILSVLQGRWIGQGSKVDEFEALVSEEFSIPFTTAVNCGSSALRLALALAGVGPGDEVITTPQCCTATNHPILEQFATPIFADIQYLTGNIDPVDVERRITERTKAIIGVDLGGYPCDIHDLQSIAERFGLTFIEDASDALGATYRSETVGSIARFTVFSFAAVQHVTTAEGGMLCCTDEQDSEAARRRRWYGIDRKRRTPTSEGYFDFDITETGYGYHMTNIAAAMGLGHLARVNDRLARRREIAARYQDALRSVPGLQLFDYKNDRVNAFQLFTIHVQNRDGFCRMMRENKIDTSIVHGRNDQYSVFGRMRHDLPSVTKYAETNISLPIHDKLTDQDFSYILQTIQAGW
jgi:perosamine synthetase